MASRAVFLSRFVSLLFLITSYGVASRRLVNSVITLSHGFRRRRSPQLLSALLNRSRFALVVRHVPKERRRISYWNPGHQTRTGGETVAQLKRVYGRSLRYVPAPKPFGIGAGSVGYVVNENSGDLSFDVTTSSRVTKASGKSKVVLARDSRTTSATRTSGRSVPCHRPRDRARTYLASQVQLANSDTQQRYFIALTNEPFDALSSVTASSFWFVTHT